MYPKEEDAVWCLVMFDLPVQTKTQRREAAKFRKLLVDTGFAMVQFSVYGKYSPTVHSNQAIEKLIRSSIPNHGEVRILHLTDHQWSTATRFIAQKPEAMEEAYVQLQLF